MYTEAGARDIDNDGLGADVRLNLKARGDTDTAERSIFTARTKLVDMIGAAVL